MTTLRHTRFQAAIVQDDAVLLLQCALRNGPIVWMLPGGGRDEGEEEECEPCGPIQQCIQTLRNRQRSATVG